MKSVEVGALAQNAAAVIADARNNGPVTILDRGRPVALLTALPHGRLDSLLSSGRARPRRRRMSDLDLPTDLGDASSATLSDALQFGRVAERY